MSGAEDLSQPAQWRAYRAQTFPHESWRAGDGMFEAVAGAPRVDLVTRARCADFVFDFEWAVPEGGNSGVLYRVRETAEAAWRSGPEMQLLDDARHPDGREPVTRCGALYGLLQPQPATPVPAGRFVPARIVVSGWHVEHWLGGICVLSCDLSDPALRARIAQSKFARFPVFAREREGHLALQHHGDAVRFRRLRLERA